MKNYRGSIDREEEFIVDSEEEAQDIANDFQVYCEPCVDIEKIEDEDDEDE